MALLTQSCASCDCSCIGSVPTAAPAKRDVGELIPWFTQMHPLSQPLLVHMLPDANLVGHNCGLTLQAFHCQHRLQLVRR